MLKDRVLTALVLLAVFFASLMASSPVLFGILALVFIAIAAWEWGRLSGYQEGISCGLSLAVVITCYFVWRLNLVDKIPAQAWFFFAASWVLWALWLLNGGVGRWFSFSAQIRLILGFVILCVAWSALWYSKMQGNNYLLSVLFLIWMSDTGAYFSGKKFGKYKLAPSISPGKTIEGAIGAVCTVILLAGIWVIFDLSRDATGADASIFTKLIMNGNMFYMVLAVIGLTFIGILGDLVESLMKRCVGVKDSGGVLPGHGGVLDRIDALLPVLPLAAGFACAFA